MQPTRNLARPADQEVHYPLPPQLAESLEPTVRRALTHGMRRRILRTLNQDRSALTLQELATVFPKASLSTLSYHVLVLRDCGAVAIAGVEPAEGTLARSFVAVIAENTQITAVLDATERLDDVR
jgi:DNA-binding transcriptional ArsR family regulator